MGSALFPFHLICFRTNSFSTLDALSVVWCQLVRMLLNFLRVGHEIQIFSEVLMKMSREKSKRCCLFVSGELLVRRHTSCRMHICIADSSEFNEVLFPVKRLS